MATSFPYHRKEMTQQPRGSDGIPVLAPREGAMQRFSGAGIGLIVLLQKKEIPNGMKVVLCLYLFCLQEEYNGND